MPTVYTKYVVMYHNPENPNVPWCFCIQGNGNENILYDTETQAQNIARELQSTYSDLVYRVGTIQLDPAVTNLTGVISYN